MMNPFRFSARSLNTAAYLPLDSCALEARIRHAGGTGEAAHPHAWDVTVINHAGCDWQGVIRIALPVAALPRFYLPGFMYGTNRGEAPLVTDSKTPSLRLQGEFPASPWWMVRSDRLSHPVAMAFAGGRFAGLATAPYFVTCGEERIGWTPGVDGAFDQYTGFGCSLEAGEVSVTLGYENAPWFFLQSHNYWQQEFTAANCLTLRAGEELTMRVYQFDYPAQDERGLHDGLKTVYRLWHQPPRERTGVRQTVQDIASAIARDAWLPEHHAYSGFVFDRGITLSIVRCPPSPGQTAWRRRGRCSSVRIACRIRRCASRPSSALITSWSIPSASAAGCPTCAKRTAAGATRAGGMTGSLRRGMRPIWWASAPTWC